jgi:hypothetical protein
MPWHLYPPPRQQEIAPSWGKTDIKKFKELVNQGKIDIFDTKPATMSTLLSGALKGNFVHVLQRDSCCSCL